MKYKFHRWRGMGELCSVKYAGLGYAIQVSGPHASNSDDAKRAALVAMLHHCGNAIEEATAELTRMCEADSVEEKEASNV